MKHIEGLACVNYKETLGNYIISTKPKEFILESNPGLSYYGRFSFPLSSIAHDLYLIVEPYKHCHQDTVLRQYQTIKKCMQEDFSAFPCQIQSEKNTFSAVKLQVQKASHVGDIVKAFINEGMKFKKNKKINKFEANITSKEYVKLKFSEDNIYKDFYNEDVAYIEIPEQINLDKLQEAEKILKNTFKYKDFKTSLLSLYQADKYREFISIFIPGGCNCDRLQEIRENFIKQIY